MSREEYTDMGGDQRGFQTTHWTVIEQARAQHSRQAQIVVGELLEAYWKPVYCYLRHKGYDNEEAKDLTQDFFHEVVLGRELIQRADRMKGRFRTLLLRALDRYLVSVHRKRTARKRIPPDKLVTLEEDSLGELSAVIDPSNSEGAFNYTWVSELLDKMIVEVKAACLHDDMAIHWSLFHDRVLQPIIMDQAPPSLGELCSVHGIEEAAKASNMIFAVKRRFQAALRRRLRQSVVCDTEVEEEIGELTRFLTGSRQYDG
jgi:RNA polymerase sigma-70 factor (ECF subfamily)